MEQNPHIWKTWAENLDHWGVKNLTATFLEALGPLNMFGAQFVYVGQPFFNQFFPKGHLDALAGLLEDPQKTQDFVSVLRQQDRSKGT